MRLQDSYDWLVLGSHPGALLTASLVAKLGLSVLILPLDSRSGLLSSSSGQKIDLDPNYVMGVGKVGKVEGLVLKCLLHLGVTPTELNQIQIENGIPQVLTPESRISLLGNENLIWELQREYGKSFAKQVGIVGALKQTESEYLSYWQNLPKRLTITSDRKRVVDYPMSLNQLRRKLTHPIKALAKAQDSFQLSWISRRKTLAHLSGKIDRENFEEAIRGFWYGITSHHLEDPSLFDVLHILNLSRTGGTFRGGMTAYRDFLMKLAKRLGVQVLPNTEFRRLFINKGRFAGVQVTNRGNMISVGGGVLGCSLNYAYERMTFSGTNLFRRRKRPLVPDGWRFTISMIVHQEAIPPGMLKRVFWREKNAPIIEIEIVDPQDYGQNDLQHRILYLRTVMPFHPDSLKLEYQRIIAGRMLRQVTEIAPFLEFHVTRIYPDFRVGRNLDSILGVAPKTENVVPSEENELNEVYGFTSLDKIPENLLVYSGSGVGSSTGIDGLFLASNESYPELGSLGPTVAALESVSWLAHRSGFPGPL